MTASPLIALRIDVESLRGTRDGVGPLLDILCRQEAGATFLFALGEDVRRRHTDILRATREAGFEVGVQSCDSRRWQRRAEDAGSDWTSREMSRAFETFSEVFGESPSVHGASGWQMNAHALRLTQRLGYACASDCRGTGPFLPLWNAEIVRCPQLPTTLPTLDELVGQGDETAASLPERLLALTAGVKDHVFTLRAEAEGMPLSSAFERLLAGWRSQGYRLTALRELAAGIDVDTLPRCELVRGTVPGRSGSVMLQGEPFLSSWKVPE